VDLTEYLYGEVFLGYKILHGQVSRGDKLHVGGVVSLATSSSMVVGLLHKQAQPNLHATVGYVVVCDMMQRCYMFYGTQHKIGFCGVATVDLRCCTMFFLIVQHVF
jgi:hypothetical protein